MRRRRGRRLSRNHYSSGTALAGRPSGLEPSTL